jgi:hypothetical protein
MRIEKDPGPQTCDELWRVLGIDARRNLDRLLARLDRAFEPPSTLARLGVPSRALPDHPTGMLLVGGMHGDRLAAVLRPKGDGDMALLACYPWLELGTQTTVRLRRVQEWGHGLCARVDASVLLDDGGELPLSWFDPLYARDWPHYAVLDDRPMDVLLSALANQMLVVPPGQSPTDTGSAPWLDGGGLKLLAIESAGSDAWAFRGRVAAVERTSLFDAEAWWVKVEFIRWRGEMRTLRIAVSRAALEGNVPVTGDEVVGMLRLQGWLWATA